MLRRAGSALAALLAVLAVGPGTAAAGVNVFIGSSTIPALAVSQNVLAVAADATGALPGPVLGGFPSASTTGVPAGTVLTTYSGANPITVANTIVDGKRILGGITINASGVVIKNSYISAADTVPMYCPNNNACGNGATPLTIQDSEIDCTGNGASGTVGQGTGITEENFTLLRVNLHGCENGVSADEDVRIEDSYIHDLYNDPTVPPPDGAHADGIQFGSSHWNGTANVSGGNNITIKHNTIYGMGWPNSETSLTFGTSAIISNHGANPDHNVLIENNLMAGGAVALYCVQDGIAGVNYQVINNRFSTQFGPSVGAFGISTGCSDETQSGNVLHETGAALTLE